MISTPPDTFVKPATRGSRFGRATLLGALTLSAALAITGCGSATPAAPSASPTPAASGHGHEAPGHDGHDHGDATETTEASPRLVVATETGVAVLDEKLQTLDTFATDERPTLATTHNGRHVAAVQGKAGKVNIVDGGSWAQGHGEHFHYFTAKPEMFKEALEGGKPVHVVGNAKADVTAIYFDAKGSADLVTGEALHDEELHGLKSVAAKSPHHGVVVPLADGSFLVSQKGADALPDVIEWVDASGKAKGSYACKGMHGEAVVGNVAAFGCVDSILVVRDGVESRVANPDASGERVGGLVADAKAKTFVGDWAADSLVFINGADTKVVSVGSEYSNLAATPDGRFATLTTDGVVHIYDATGTETEHHKVTGAWKKPTGHGGLAPSIAAGDLAGATVIWVTEPDAGKVHALDPFAKKVTTVDVTGKPGSLAVTNAG